MEVGDVTVRSSEKPGMEVDPRIAREKKRIMEEKAKAMLAEDRKARRPVHHESTVFRCDGCKKYFGINTRTEHVADLSAFDHPMCAQQLTVKQRVVQLCKTCNSSAMVKPKDEVKGE